MHFGKHILYRKWQNACMTTVIGLCVGTSLVCEAKDIDLEWLQRSKEIVRQVEQQETLPDWLRMTPGEEAEAYAKEIFNDALSKLPEEITAGPDRQVQREKEQRSVIAFVSLSMPEAELKSLLQAASGKEVMLVLRGMMEGGDLGDTLRKFHQLAKNIEPLPSVSINPKLFKELNIKTVPTLVTGYKTEITVHVRGSISIDWFKRQAAGIKRGENTDLGIRGTTYEIAEADLVEEMKIRLAKLDLNAKKESLYDDYWKKRRSIQDLPPAQKDRTFTVDPSFIVTEDVRTSDDTIIAFKGTRINPFTQIPFTKTVVVFNGTSKQQLAKAKQLTLEIRSKGKGLILITTKVDEEKGWKSLEDMQTHLQYRVYVLNKEMVNAFHLQKVPAMIRQDGMVFKIQEFKVTL